LLGVTLGLAKIDGDRRQRTGWLLFLHALFGPRQKSKSADFVKKYQAKFHALPDGMAPLGYDAMTILAQAINTADRLTARKCATRWQM